MSDEQDVVQNEEEKVEEVAAEKESATPKKKTRAYKKKSSDDKPLTGGFKPEVEKQDGPTRREEAPKAPRGRNGKPAGFY